MNLTEKEVEFLQDIGSAVTAFISWLIAKL